MKHKSCLLKSKRNLLTFILGFILIFIPIDLWAIESDDFNAGLLDTGLWTFVDPVGDGDVTLNGIQALISVPGGTSHDVWSSGNFAPRIMQPAADEDFEIEVKFESSVTTKYQIQGLLAEQDAGNFIRTDFFSDGASIRAFAAVFINGSPSVKKNISLGISGSPLYMRLKRQGDVWTQSYSQNGVNWQTAVTFTHALAVDSVGVFAGNAGSNAPAHTAVVDYFFNTASPIIPEDGETLYTLTVNATGSGNVTKNPDQASYLPGDVVELTAVPSAGWTFDGWSGDAGGLDNPLSVTVDADLIITANFVTGPAVEYTLDVTTAGSGQVTLNPPGGFYNEGTTVQLSAVGDAGWQFTGWSGDLNGAANPATIVMTQDYAVVSNFETDTSPPVISNIQVAPGQNSATVTWSTDEPTTGVVDYGESTSYELGSVPDTALLQDHSVVLTGLSQGVAYHLQITATDNTSNSTVSADVPFSTTLDPSSGIESDDFNAGSLDTGLWTFVDPVGDGDVVLNGTQALISVPGGTSHDVWSSGNFAPRIMQAAADEDFEIEVKFESSVTAQYQIQGLLAEQDAGNFIRTDFFSDGASIRAFAAVFINGSPSVKKNISLGISGSPLYMRLKRQGDVWTQSYSQNGVNWQTAVTFTHALAVDSVGVFAGNAGSNAPAHTAVVDYFFNTASPIIPEDGETLYTLTVNATGSGNVTKNPDQASYLPGDVVELTAVPSAGWTFDGWSGDAGGLDNPLSVTVDADLIITANFVTGPAVEYTLDVTTAGSGQVTLNPPGGFYNEGTTVQLSAVGDAGWQFTGWSGDLNGAANPATIVMTQDYAVVSNFETDTSPPVISNIQVAPGQNSATVTWSTDEPTTGVVDYGESTSYELGSVPDTALLQDHSVVLTGLSQGVAYHLQITATDNTSNSTVSADVPFSTTLDPSSGIESDDFNAGSLDTGLWTFVDPVGDGDVVLNGTQALISVPGGTSHDVWSSGNFAPRIMQAAADEDFEIEVKFESSVTAQYQIQGLLAEQDAGNFIRTDFFSDGASIRAFAAVFINGSPSVKKNISLGISGSPLYMRLKRQGDVWTQSYSQNGVNWQTAVTFTHALAVDSVGVFAGNAGSNAPAHTAVVDYFFNTASPIIPEDGETLYTLTVNATGSGNVTKNPDQASYLPGDVVELTAVPSAGWTFDGWSGDATGFENPLSVTVDADLIIEANFVTGPAVDYTLDVTTVGSGNVTINPDQTSYLPGDVVELTAVPSAGWTFDGWSGDAGGLDNPLSVTVDADLIITANFVTGPVVEYTLDVTTAGSGQVTLNPPGGLYNEGTTVELSAVGDAGWQFTGWSGDLSGTANPATIVMTQDSAVVGNFETDTSPPVISNIQVVPSQNSATLTWSTDEPTTGVVDYGESTSYELGSVPDTALLQDHSVVLTGLSQGVDYHLQITATDNTGNSTASADVPFSTTLDPSSGIESDDFNAGALDTGLWTFVDPVGDGDVVLNGTQALISVPGGTSHDVWSSGNFAPRIMQAAADEDFEIEVKFESSVTAQYQIQGLLAEQDAGNFIRVDFYSNGSSIRAFAAVFVDGSPSVKKNISLGISGISLYMRLKRQGDVWTQSYSDDGVNWQTAVTFTHALAVDSVGVFAGNAGSNAPAHTAVVDYFFNTASPIIPEDGETLYTLTVNATGSGNVTKNPDQTSYLPGDVVELTAIPSAGWTFDGWSGDATGFENPLSVTVDAELIITANFVTGPAVEYTLDVTTAGSGQVTLTPPGGVYTEGTTVQLSAVGDAGWQFSGWSGDLSGTANPATIVMTQDYAVVGNFETDTSPPVISNIQVVPGQDSATVTWTTDEPTTGVVDYGESESYELGFEEDTALLQDHSVVLTGLSSGVDYHYQITAADRAGLESSSSDLIFTLTEGPIIDVWYGLEQTFGSYGIPQQWVNLLGNVSDSDGLSQFTFSLNGGSVQNLSIGPFRRLEEPGDFNVEIDYADLVDGVNQVNISAEDGIGNISLQSVTVNYSSGNIWPLNYSVDWSTVNKIEDVAQIVDGLWEISNNKLRPVKTGYDRTVAIGDIAWTDYEVIVPVTIHDIDPKGFEGINYKPAIGVMLKWPGHTNWTGNQQPSYGWYPGGGGGWYQYNTDGSANLFLTDFQGLYTIDPLNRSLFFEVTYIWKVRVETLSGGNSQYSLKIWDSSQSEPEDWELVDIDTNDVDGGSMLLVAHYVDVSFGDIIIQPIN